MAAYGESSYGESTYGESGTTSITVAGEKFVATATMLDGSLNVGIRINGEAFVAAATMLDGTINSGLVVAGEAFVATTTMLDGTLLVGLKVDGEAFSATATMLDGTVSTGITVLGEKFISSATMLDGSPKVGITVLGEKFVAAATMLDGAIVAGAILIVGEAFTNSFTVLNGEVKKLYSISPSPVQEVDAPKDLGVYVPSGDRFGDAIIITGSNGTLDLTFTAAGTEAGEPLPAGVSKTVWLIWLSDEQDNPRVLFDTGDASIAIGSDSATVAGFSSTWSGEGGLAAYPDALSIYRVQLGWRTGDPTDITITWESDDPPFYDEFSTPYELTGDEDRANLSTEFCTIQTSESVPVGTFTTAWSRWAPVTAGDATIETSDPALIIRVYEDGVDISSLTFVASGTGSVSFTASVAPYLIQVCDTEEPGV